MLGELFREKLLNLKTGTERQMPDARRTECVEMLLSYPVVNSGPTVCRYAGNIPKPNDDLREARCAEISEHGSARSRLHSDAGVRSTSSPAEHS